MCYLCMACCYTVHFVHFGTVAQYTEVKEKTFVKSTGCFVLWLYIHVYCYWYKICDSVWKYKNHLLCVPWFLAMFSWIRVRDSCWPSSHLFVECSCCFRALVVQIWKKENTENYRDVSNQGNTMYLWKEKVFIIFVWLAKEIGFSSGMGAVDIDVFQIACVYVNVYFK